MSLTRKEIRRLCQVYTMLKAHVRQYESHRQAILDRYSGSLVVVRDTKHNPGDPTLKKVCDLEELGLDYRNIVLVTRAVDDALAFMLPGKDHKKIFNLHFVKGLTVCETARVTHLSTRTAQRRVSEILETISYWLSRDTNTFQAAKELTEVF